MMDSTDYENLQPAMLLAQQQHQYQQQLSSTTPELPFSPTPLTTPSHSTYKTTNTPTSTRHSSFQDRRNFTLASPKKTLSNSSDVCITDYKKIERQFADSIIKNKDLIREQERLEQELSSKDKLIELKNIRINELIQENGHIVKDLRNERELNQKEFESWSETKAKLERKVKELNKNLQNSIDDHKALEMSALNNNSGNSYNDLDHKEEIDKLMKKIKILEKENELEIHSKMIIIDELEMLKERWNQLQTNYDELKEEYHDIVYEISGIQEESGIKDEGSDISDDNELQTETLSRTLSSFQSDEDHDDMEHMKQSLADELNEFGGLSKSRVSSLQVSTNHSSRKSSYRHSSFNKILKDIEVQALEQKYSQEMVKMDFQLKSLQLQNDKLHAYIGFILQQQNNSNSIDNINNNNNNNSNNNNTDMIFKDTINYEYSDEINIRSAKKNLKSIIRSASALPIRPYAPSDSFEKHQTINEESSLPSTRNSSGTAVRRASDYNARTKRWSYNSISDNELQSRKSSIDNPFTVSPYSNQPETEDTEIDYLEIGDTQLLNTSDEYESDDDEIIHHKAANNSINVSFTVDLTPALTLKKRKSSKLFRRTPRNQLQKLTTFGSPYSDHNNHNSNNNAVNNNDSSCGGTPTKKLTLKSSIRSLRKYASNLALIGELVEEEEEENDGSEDSTVVTYSDLLRRFDAVNESVGAQREVPWVFDDLSSSSSDLEQLLNDSAVLDEDDDILDKELTIEITEEELAMFKVIQLKKLMCPKHHIFQCCCKSMNLVDPRYYYLAISPVSFLNKNDHDHDHCSGEQGEFVDVVD